MAVEDATVADVTGRHRANATVFNRIAQALDGHDYDFVGHFDLILD